MEQQARIMQLQPGATVLVKDSPNTGYFYIVKSGSLYVSGSQFSEKELSRFEAGDTFGLVSALTVGKHLGTVRARTDATLIRVPIASLGEYLRKHREVCLKMLQLYSRELKALDKHLAKLNERTSWDNQPEKLFLDHVTYAKLGQKLPAAHSLAVLVEWLEAHPESPAHRHLAQARKTLAETYGGYTLPTYEGNRLQVKAGTVLFVENEPSRFAYVVTSGSVRISKLVQAKEFVVAVVGPGEIVGEQSILDHKPYAATAVCTSASEIVRFPEERFLEEAGEKILQKIFESLARRIWFSHQRLSILRLADPTARLFFFLLFLCHSSASAARKDSEHEFLFDFALADLEKMCGLLRIRPETISAFLEDPNITIGKGTVGVRTLSGLEARVHAYRHRKMKTQVLV